MKKAIFFRFLVLALSVPVTGVFAMEMGDPASPGAGAGRSPKRPIPEQGGTPKRARVSPPTAEGAALALATPQPARGASPDENLTGTHTGVSPQLAAFAMSPAAAPEPAGLSTRQLRRLRQQQSGGRPTPQRRPRKRRAPTPEEHKPTLTEDERTIHAYVGSPAYQAAAPKSATQTSPATAALCAAAAAQAITSAPKSLRPEMASPAVNAALQRIAQAEPAVRSDADRVQILAATQDLQRAALVALFPSIPDRRPITWYSREFYDLLSRCDREQLTRRHLQVEGRLPRELRILDRLLPLKHIIDGDEDGGGHALRGLDEYFAGAGHFCPIQNSLTGVIFAHRKDQREPRSLFDPHDHIDIISHINATINDVDSPFTYGTGRGEERRVLHVGAGAPTEAIVDHDPARLEAFLTIATAYPIFSITPWIRDGTLTLANIAPFGLAAAAPKPLEISAAEALKIARQSLARVRANRRAYGDNIQAPLRYRNPINTIIDIAPELEFLHKGGIRTCWTDADLTESVIPYGLYVAFPSSEFNDLLGELVPPALPAPAAAAAAAGPMSPTLSPRAARAARAAASPVTPPFGLTCPASPTGPAAATSPAAAGPSPRAGAATRCQPKRLDFTKVTE